MHTGVATNVQQSAASAGRRVKLTSSPQASRAPNTRLSLPRRVVLLAGAAAIILSTAHSQTARAAEVEFLLTLQHTSALLRGPPFNDKDESQHDYLSPIGMTITAGKRQAWELDLSHGIKFIDRGHRESGTEFAVRFYPGRIWRTK